MWGDLFRHNWDGVEASVFPPVGQWTAHFANLPGFHLTREALKIVFQAANAPDARIREPD